MLEINCNTSRIALFEGDPVKFKRKARLYKQVYYSEGNYPEGDRVAEDLFTAIDFYQSNYMAGKEINWIYDRFLVKNEKELVNTVLGSKIGHLFIKKQVLRDIGRIYAASIYVNKFIEKYKVESAIEFIPKDISFEIYSLICKEKNIFPESVCIPSWYLREVKRKETIWRFLCRYSIILYPLYLSIYMKWRKVDNIAIKKFKYGIHVWDSGTHHFIPPYTNDFLRIISKGGGAAPALYVIESNIQANMDKQNLEKIKQTGFDVCYFYEMIRETSIRTFFLSIFPKFIRTQWQLIFNNSDKYTVRKIYLKIFMKQILWEIFFSKYSIEKFIAFQEPGDIARSVIQNNHGPENAFVFWSSSYDSIYREDMNAQMDSNYSYMYYGDMISSKVSIDYFKKNNNYFDHYMDSGIIFSDYAYRTRRNNAVIAEIKRNLNIPENKIVISVFDTAVGKNGMFDLNEGTQMAIDILKLIRNSEDCFFIFKTRTVKKLPNNSIIREKYYEIETNERVCFLGNDSPYMSTELMGVSDLVISAFTSSVSLEAVSGGIKAINYTPERFLKVAFSIVNFPKFFAKNYNQLEEYKNYWLNECGLGDLDDFQNKYIKEYIDPYCDGKANNRLIQFLI